MFAFQGARGRVQAAFTDRHGGVSAGPYASLNLAATGDERPETAARNLDLVGRAFARGHQDPQAPLELPPGIPVPRLALMHQVHGADVRRVTADALESGDPAPDVDALVTTDPGVLLVVRVADCVPVLLADGERGVVGAAHAGRPGLAAGVVPNAVAAMRDLGADRIMAWVGPHVCGSCYEVPETMRAEVAAAVPESYARTSWGTPALDIGAGVRAQLDAAGVDVVDASPRCTREDPDLYSYRRQGVESGRLAGLVWLRP